ncbi:hypothetical protein [Cuneatibacter caecimuris]|uniref:Uncharacterized protein n=1 Tax=Cuneatibacter caecimuris TaxID=1796618 RepID=A0A4Q7PLZ0_9FIRM|nr:hypothetical protein [Cuneatibacter caecimuris]RZT00900.1 hypothetical protein EV209_1336 [Cuneatibacter caecimuris]
MSDIRRAGAPYQYKGKEYELVMTVNVIDQIQETFDIHINEISKIIGDMKSRSFYKNIASIITIMLNEAIEIQNEENGEKNTPINEAEVRRYITNVNINDAFMAIANAYSLAFLMKEEDDIGENDPNRESGKSS